MARVPTYDSFQVTPNTLPTTQLQTPRALDFAGPQMQRDAQMLSGVGQQLADIAIKEQEKANRLRTDDALLQFAEARTELQAEALQIRGRNALERPDGKSLAVEYSEKLKKVSGELQSQLSNDVQRQMFAVGARQMGPKFYAALTQHEGREYETFQKEHRKALMDTAIQQAAGIPSDDEIFEQSLRMLHGSYREQIQAEGGSDEMFTAGFRELADQAFYARYKAWQQEDALSALANFQQHKGAISPLMRDRIDKELFTRAAPELAAMAKPWVLTQGAAPAGDARLAAEPRGIRNANPGNLVKGDSEWQGQVPGGDPRFVTFATPEHGIRAMGKTLLTYQDQYGLDTVEKIVSRWAPASENPTTSYTAAVAKALRIAPDTKIDLRNPSTMSRIVRAMINVENGKQPYTIEQVERGVNAALDLVQLPKPKAPTEHPRANWQDDQAQTGLALVDRLAPDQRLRVFQLARSQANQDMTQARQGLQQRVQDAAAQYLSLGEADNPPSADDFVRAYGQDEGMRRYQELENTATLGLQLQQMKTLSNADIVALVDDSAPAPGEGFATQVRNFEILQKAAAQTVEARRGDPIRYALQNPAFGIQPIANFADGNAVGVELGRRKAVMGRIAADYGTSPALLTNEEAARFGKHLDTLQAPDKARALANFAAAGGVEGARSLSVQLKDNHNTLAVAAMLSAYTTAPVSRWFGPDTPGANVGQMYLEGKDAIEQKRAYIDQQAEFGVKAEIFNAILDVYQTPQARDAAAEAAYGIYAKLQADGSGNVDRAVDLATGGIMEVNGGKIAKPYGWDDSQFRDAMWHTLPELIEKAGGYFIAGGLQVSAADFAKSLPGARLKTYGQGTYLVMSGNDVVRNLDGTPYILAVGP